LCKLVAINSQLGGAITRLLKRFDGTIVNQGRSLSGRILQEEVAHTLEKYAWMELLIMQSIFRLASRAATLT